MAIPLEPTRSPGQHVEDAADPLTIIRRRQQQLADATTEVFEIAEYDGDLAVRYQRLDLAKYREVLLATGGAEWEPFAQFLIDACVEILRRNPDGELEPLIDGRVTTFNDIGPLLGFPEGSTARQDVLAVWGGNQIRLADHADDVSQWMRAAQAVVDAAAMGGS